MPCHPEVLAPAGDMEKLIMAVTYGADAVYLAGTRYGMRAGTDNFTREELAEAIRFAHAHGVRVYVTCNTIPLQSEIAELPGYLSFLNEAGADAVIVTDLGVLKQCLRYAPRCEVHVSTQAGVMNSAAALAFHELGAKRVILAREAKLSDIAAMRAVLPEELELEVFCHGAMCVSFSGRCTLSNYLTGRDANRGKCAQPCRWKYRLMEEKRPGELLEISEDGGTYILNSRDLCLIDHVPELLEAGVSSLKIEGRTKSAYYVSSATAAYRHAVDAAAAGRTLSPVWREEVLKASHRPYSTGFLFGEPGQYTDGADYFSSADVIAMVESCGPDGEALLTQRNRFYPGEEAELLRPDGDPIPFTVGPLRDGEGTPVEAARHPRMEIRTRLPVRVPKYSWVRRTRTGDLSGHRAETAGGIRK